MSITEAIIKKAAGEYDCEVIKRLNLEKLGLVKICNLGACTILCELYLGRNEVSSTIVHVI